MKRIILSLMLALCAGIPTLAQRVTASFSETPLPDALLELERQCEGIHINFIYDDLKDFRATLCLDNLPLKEAIHAVVDGRPIRVIRKKNKYFLSIVPTPRLKITGRVQ